MIVFATSDKGGTGRSVTSCNLAYRLALRGLNTAYVDYDFGSPTAGAVFEISAVERGARPGQGVHTYLKGDIPEISRVDVRAATDREKLRAQRSRGGKLFLYPGEEGGGEAMAGDDPSVVQRCVDLLLDLDNKFKVVIVDLSSGRSVAMRVALEATAPRVMPGRQVHWLVFHRWTRQHIMAANSLVHGFRGLIEQGIEGEKPLYTEAELLGRLRYVRTAVPVPGNPSKTGDGRQAAWLIEQNDMLRSLAATNKLGDDMVLGSTPVEPVLQWREQIILDSDVNSGFANQATADAFTDLAKKLVDEGTWVPVGYRSTSETEGV